MNFIEKLRQTRLQYSRQCKDRCTSVGYVGFSFSLAVDLEEGTLWLLLGWLSFLSVVTASLFSGSDTASAAVLLGALFSVLPLGASLSKSS